MKIVDVIATGLLAMCTGSVFAQHAATAAANATIVAPITLSKDVDMSFGNAAVSATSGGMITLSPANTRTTAGAGVTLPATAGTVSAATFTVSGAAGYTYAISLPPSAVITGPGATTMTVTSFTSVPSATGTLSSAGTQSLKVGATLYIAPAQPAGTYTNAAGVPITVNYN